MAGLDSKLTLLGGSAGLNPVNQGEGASFNFLTSDADDERQAPVMYSQSRSQAIPAAFSCQQILSTLLAGLDYNVLTKSAVPAILDHPAGALLEDPHPSIPRQTLFEEAFRDMFRNGNGALWISRRMRGTGYPARLEPCRIVQTRRDRGRFLYTIDIAAAAGIGNTRQVTVSESNLLHFRFAGYDFATGMSPSPIRLYAKNALGISDSIMRHMQTTLKKGAQSPVYIMMADGMDAGEENAEVDRLLKNATGLQNAGKPVPLPAGWKVIKTGFSSVDLQLVQVYGLSIADISRVYTMPLALINADERGSGWSANTLPDRWTGLIRTCLGGHAKRIEQEMAKKLLVPQDTGLRLVKADLTSLTMSTMEDAVTTFRNAVGGPFLVPNEARARLGYEQTDWGESPYPAPGSGSNSLDSGQGAGQSGSGSANVGASQQ